MNQQNYLPLPLSKLVHAKVPMLETETEMWMLASNNDNGWVLSDEQWNDDDPPALRLDDLLHACNHLVIEGGGDIGMVMTECDRLLIAYLSDNLRLDGKNVEEFITNTFV